MSNHTIAIYHYFIQDPYRIDCAVSHSIEILFQRNGAISPSPWFIVVICCLYFFCPLGRVRPIVGITDYIIITFLRISYYRYISLFNSRPLSDLLCGVTLSRNFILAQWCHITAAMVCCFYFLSIFVSSLRMSEATNWDH